jgi:uncharacterized protein YndB with AHSA1/START domain
MPDILHRVGINVPAGRVFEALSTVEGLRHWWTTETSGNPQQGGMIDFGFCAMRVLESRTGELVQWECVRGPEDWIGTEVSFQLIPKDHQTFVLFKHAHWKEPVEFMHHCSTKWATFLLSLRDWLERNEGRPVPYDVKIHVGD